MRGTFLAKTCPTCEKPFEVPYRKRAIVYCSCTCSARARRIAKLQIVRELALAARPEECIIWGGSISHSGYGRIGDPPNLVMVHRLAFEIAKHPIPAGMMVCHHCDVKLCFNPHHLFVGTAKDNARDYVLKGLAENGERNRNAVLKEDNVLEMRSLGLSPKEASNRYGISLEHARRVLNGINWAHMPTARTLRGRNVMRDHRYVNGVQLEQGEREVAFGFLPPLPLGVAVFWSEATEHYHWRSAAGEESDMHVDRYAVRRGAIAHMTATGAEPPCPACGATDERERRELEVGPT